MCCEKSPLKLLHGQPLVVHNTLHLIKKRVTQLCLGKIIDLMVYLDCQARSMQVFEGPY